MCVYKTGIAIIILVFLVTIVRGQQSEQELSKISQADRQGHSDAHWRIA